MRILKCYTVGLIATALFATTVAATAGAPEPAGREPWKISDSIELTKFIAPTGLGRWRGAKPEIIYSPSGGHFFVVSETASLSCDCTISRLLIYDTNDLKLAHARPHEHKPSPIRTVEFATQQHELPAIYEPSWSDDDTIVLVGGNRSSERVGHVLQIYRYSVKTNRLHRLSNLLETANPQSPLITRAVGSASGTLFQTFEIIPLRPEPYPFSFVTELDWRQVRGPEQNGQILIGMHLIRSDGKSVVLGTEVVPLGVSGSVAFPDSMPPGSRYSVVAVSGAEAIPSSWKAYDRLSSSANTYARFQRINLSTGSLTPVMDAPLGTATEMGRRFAHGFSNSAGRYATLQPRVLAVRANQFILINAALPLSTASPERAHSAYVLSYNAQNGTVTTIAPLESEKGSISDVQLSERGKCLTLTWLSSASNSISHYSMKDSNWVPDDQCRDTSPDEPGRARVWIEEGLNVPPRLMVEQQGRRLVVLDTAESIKGAWAPVEPFQWTESDGREFSGGLILPGGRQHNALPLPLVIYPNGFDGNGFWPDGVSPGFSAQQLAAAGIAVAQIEFANIDRPEVSETVNEGPAEAARVDAVVAKLAASGLVDPQRVAMVGFSHGGYMTRYVASFPGRVKLAAGIVDDGFDAGFVTGMINGTSSGDVPLKTFVGNLGGQPFWKDKSGWLKRSPGLNAESLRTPLMILGRGGPGYLFGAIEPFSAAKLIDAPIEFGQFSTGSHLLSRPRERLAKATIDLAWLKFWLKGEEDASLVSNEVYERWRKLRGVAASRAAN